MTIKKLAVACGISAAFGLGAVGNAQADAIANSLIDVSNFILLGNGGVQLSLADFVPGSLAFQDNLTNTANLNPGGFQAQFATTSGFVPATDALQACVGACVFGQNDFTVHNPPPTSNYARSDSLLTGVPITGTLITPVVRAATIAETSIHGNASGGSNSDILLTSSLQFVLAHNIGGAGISFDATAFLRAWTAAGTTTGTLAGAGYKWELKLVDGVTGATLIDWQPDGNTATGVQTGLNVTSEACNLVDNATAGPNQPSAPADDCTGHFFATTNFALLANHPYSFTIDQHVTTQAQETVAEPQALALLGLGLAALGFIRRRKN